MWRIRDVYPGSRILIFTHPGSRIPDLGSRIPDPGYRIQKQQQKTGVKKFFVKPFFVASNFTKLNIILFLICWRKKIGPIFQELLKYPKKPKKLSPSPQKYGFGIRDPGSGKNLFLIPDPGVKKAPDPGSGSATLDFCIIKSSWVGDLVVKILTCYFNFWGS